MLLSTSFVGMSYTTEKSSSVYKPNNPPYVPSNPVPPNGSTNVTTMVLCWTGGDPDGDEVFYNVYFGNTSPPPGYLYNQSNNCTPVLYLLEFNTTYYWKIISIDEHGASTEGPIWSFTTETNLPPYAPYDLKPEDGADIVPININLSWKGGDPNIGDTVIYDIYFEESDSDPSYMATIGPYNATQIEIIYHLSFDLELFKTYYWNIVATDSHGLKNTSAVYSFTTGINYPPGKPKIKGPIIIHGPGPHNYTFKAIDPDGDNVSYQIDWDDGDISNWTAWYQSGEEITQSHIYNEKATFKVKARAKDIHGAIGDWGVISLKSKQILSLSLLQFLMSIVQFTLLQRLLEWLIW